VTVFFLEGGRDVFGPRAAELTGEFYRNLWERDYFHTRNQEAQSGTIPAASTGAAQ
jgi:penicillin-binding protein 2